MAAKTCLGCVIPRNKLRIRQLALFSFIVALKLDHFGASESISWSALKRTKTRGPTARQLSYTEKKSIHSSHGFVLLSRGTACLGYLSRE